MGYVADPTEEMGEYSVEVRDESFYLRGEYNVQENEAIACPGNCDVIGSHKHSGGIRYVNRRHAITVHETGDSRQGTVEILIEDIPKIRAALDQVECIFYKKKDCEPD